MRVQNWIVLIAICCFSSGLVWASPMSPQLYERLKEEGRLEIVVSQLMAARAKGYFEVDRPSMAKPLGSRMIGDVDTIRTPVILIDFSDNQYDSYPADLEAEQFDSVLFSWGKMPNGSMTEFYWENSYQTFYLDGDVVGWYRMPQTYAYYVDGQQGWGNCPRCVDQMVIDALFAAAQDLDYSEYDNDGDDWVDGIFIVHAGYGAEETGSNNHIWSHRGGIPTQYYDGVYIGGYSIEPEVRLPGVITDIGVFCHEFGHVLNLPDLYDTDYSSSGVGRWSLMSGGSWNGNGHIPAHYDAWCKKELGFIEPINIIINTDNVEIPRAEDAPVAYRLWTEGQLGPQYFLIENRQQVLSDAALPGNGLLIWHIDETRSGNSDEDHPLVAVEQADGLFELEYGGSSDMGDPWPGSSDNREFNDFSVPNTHDYLDQWTEIGVYNISDSDSLMTADMEIVYGRPLLFMDWFQFADDGGNGNGRADPGENDVLLIIMMDNFGEDALGLTMEASTTDPEIVFSNAVSNFGDVLRGEEAANFSSPIVFSVDAEFPPTIVSFELSYSANAGEYTKVETLTVDVGPPQFLIVDDDEAIPNNYEKYYTYMLDSLRKPHVVWGKDTLSTPPVDTLSDYPITIWFTGNSRSEVLSAADVANLKDFLDGGGRLFLTGQDIAQDLADDVDSTFLHDYLFVRYVPGTPLKLVEGVPGDAIGDGQTVPLGGPGGAANQYSPDILEPLNALAKPIYTYYNSSNVAGVHVANNDYRAVYFGFGAEGIANDLGGYASREEVFERVFDWLLQTEPEYTPGDLNSDDAVNPLDLVLIVNHVYLGIYTPPIMNAADVNADCAVNPLDVVYMVNYVYLDFGELLPGCVD